MLKIRRPLGRLIFNMGIAIPGKTVFLIETAPSPPVLEVILQMLVANFNVVCQDFFNISYNQKDLNEKKRQSVVSSVPTDGLALLVATITRSAIISMFFSLVCAVCASPVKLQKHKDKLGFITWMGNRFSGFIWDVFTHFCPDFDGRLIKPPSNYIP